MGFMHDNLLRDGFERSSFRRFFFSDGIIKLMLEPGGKGHSEPERKGQIQPKEKGQTRLLLVRFTWRQGLVLQVLLPA